MSALIIDGRALSKTLREQSATTLSFISNHLKRAPKLVLCQVGDDPYSLKYLSSKQKIAQKWGIDAELVNYSQAQSQSSIQLELKKLSSDVSVDALLLQLPLPGGYCEDTLLDAIDADKDVDGLHPLNQGALFQGKRSGLVPCTPRGCVHMIKYARALLSQPTSLEGINAVVVGRSNLVGKPVAALLLQENCTVTQCHSKTRDLAQYCKRADVIVSATGVPHLIDAHSVKPGAIVIDVGAHYDDSGELRGDVDFASVKESAGAITPVPGGVGPMTIAMLMQNTLDIAYDKAKIEQSRHQ